MAEIARRPTVWDLREFRCKRLSELAPRIGLSALDLLIATYVIGLALIFLTGGFAIGGVSLREPAKPVLILLLLVPVRLALGGTSWLPGLIRRATRYAVGQCELTRARCPPAIVDTLFIAIPFGAASLSATFLANIMLDRKSVV